MEGRGLHSKGLTEDTLSVLRDGGIMETKLIRIAEISATSKHPIFTSVYHLINEDMLKQCHKELDGNKAVGIDKVTKDEYGKNLDRNIKELVQRLKNKSFKPLPSLRVYIPKEMERNDH